MARLLHHRGLSPLTLLCFTSTLGTMAFSVVVAVLAVCSIVSFLCTTHERFKSNNNMGRRGGSAGKLTVSFSDIGSRAYVKMGKMILWKKEAGGGSGVGGRRGGVEEEDSQGGKVPAA